eukprot:4925445-Prymnesium_polylepis.1
MAAGWDGGAGLTASLTAGGAAGWSVGVAGGPSQARMVLSRPAMKTSFWLPPPAEEASVSRSIAARACTALPDAAGEGAGIAAAEEGRRAGEWKMARIAASEGRRAGCKTCERPTGTLRLQGGCGGGSTRGCNA